MGLQAIAKNIYTSWAWLMPGMVQLRMKSNVYFSRAAYCCFGKPWKKSNGFLCACIQPHSFTFRCNVMHVFSTSGKPHVVFKKARTAIAFFAHTHIGEHYTRALCSRIVCASINAGKELESKNLDDFFCRIIDRR